MKTKRQETRVNPEYSTGFKIRVVKEIESGFLTNEEARRLYNIGSINTISSWIRKYGTNDRLNKKVYVMTREEEPELIQLRMENRKLVKLNGELEAKIITLETLIEVADEHYNLDLKKTLV